MKNLAIIISFVTLFTAQVFSQVEISIFNKIAGTWEASYDSNGVNHKENLQMKWLFNHNFFVVTVTDALVKQYMKYTEKEIYYFTLNDAGTLTGWYLDNSGYNSVINFDGFIDENKISLSGKNKNSECNFTFELKDNQLVILKEIKSNENGTVNREREYNIARSDEKIYSLPVKYQNLGEPGFGYICHLSENFVTVFDVKSNNLIGKINCGQDPNFICFTKDGEKGVITNFMSNDVTIFDKKTNDVIATVDAGEHPTFILPIKNKMLISHQSQDGVYVLDETTNKIIKKFSEGTGPLYLIETENKIYQPQIFCPYLFIIDPVKLEITNKIRTGGRPMEMAFIHDKRFGYMVNYDFDEVTKFDTKTDIAIKHIKNVNHPRGIASSPDGKFIYVTNVVDGKVNVINTETDSVISTIVGFIMPVYIAFTADGKYAYVVNQGASSISIIETATNTVIQTFYTAGNPITLLIDNS